jgi:hypothetical protein
MSSRALGIYSEEIDIGVRTPSSLALLGMTGSFVPPDRLTA